MANKKLWIKVLAIVAIVCMLSCFFVSCKKKEPTKIDALNPLLNGIQKSIAKGDMDNLLVSAKLDLGLTAGKSTSNYTIALDLGLNLFNKKAQNEDNGDNSTYLQAEIKKGDDVLLAIEYADYSEKDSGSAAFNAGTLYLAGKAGSETKTFAIPVPNVNSTMRALDASVDFSKVDLTDLDFSGADTILTVIGGLLDVKSTTDFALNLGKVLNSSELQGLLEGINLADLGLDLTGDQLGKVLPDISITFKPTYAKDGALTDLKLGLSISDKDIIVNNTNKEPLLVVGMNGAVKVDAGLKFNIGGDSVNKFSAINKNAAKDMNLLNLKLSAGLKIEQDIIMTLMAADAKSDGLTINLPAGDYELFVGVDADPTRILNKLFSYEPATVAHLGEAKNKDGNFDPAYFFEKVNDNLYVRTEKVITKDSTAADLQGLYYRRPNFGFNGIDQIISTIGGILQCVDALELTIKDKANGSYALRVIGAKDYAGGTSLGLKATIEAGILKDAKGNNLLGAINGLTIDELLGEGSPLMTVINKLTAPKEEVSSATDMKEIGNYLKQVFLSINGKAADAKYESGIHAKADIAKIPFSGYTEFKGAYRSDLTYFEVKEIKYEEHKAVNEKGKDGKRHFEDGVTSYTRSGTGAEGNPYVYTAYKDEAGTGPVDGVTYYKQVVIYQKANPTAENFKDGTYYVAGSNAIYYDGNKATNVAANEIFGIGLNAELKVNATNKVFIKATVNNMDVYGLPATLSVEISGNSFGLFNYDKMTWAQMTAKYAA